MLASSGTAWYRSPIDGTDWYLRASADPAVHLEAAMNLRIVFGLSVLMSFAASGLMAALCLWPALQSMTAASALTALMFAHAYRFAGLSFLVPGVVSPSLPAKFALPAAYGDFVAALLAVFAILALHVHMPGALLLVWVFNVWGTLDLLFAMVNGPKRLAESGPGALGAAFYIPTVLVPALLITHGLIFWLLLRAPAH